MFLRNVINLQPQAARRSNLQDHTLTSTAVITLNPALYAFVLCTSCKKRIKVSILFYIVSLFIYKNELKATTAQLVDLVYW
jgi:hypothetical protein